MDRNTQINIAKALSNSNNRILSSDNVGTNVCFAIIVAVTLFLAFY